MQIKLNTSETKISLQIWICQCNIHQYQNILFHLGNLSHTLCNFVYASLVDRRQFEEQIFVEKSRDNVQTPATQVNIFHKSFKFSFLFHCLYFVIVFWLPSSSNFVITPPRWLMIYYFNSSLFNINWWFIFDEWGPLLPNICSGMAWQSSTRKSRREKERMQPNNDQLSSMICSYVKRNLFPLIGENVLPLLCILSVPCFLSSWRDKRQL